MIYACEIVRYDEGDPIRVYVGEKGRLNKLHEVGHFELDQGAVDQEFVSPGEGPIDFWPNPGLERGLKAGELLAIIHVQEALNMRWKMKLPL